jgi:hypothetical protein
MSHSNLSLSHLNNSSNSSNNNKYEFETGTTFVFVSSTRQEQKTFLQKKYYFWQNSIEKRKTTVCFNYSDKGREMIIFKSIFTSFITRIVYRGSWDKQIRTIISKFSLHKSVKHTVVDE